MGQLKIGATVLAKWKGSKFTGVRWREHAKRKHGIRPDRYFAIRFKIEGVSKEEGLGWESQGWSLQKAALKLAELKIAAKTGEGFTRLSEAREAATLKKKELEAKKTAESLANITVDEYFQHYRETAIAERAPSTQVTDKSLYKVWIKPALGDKSLSSVNAVDIEYLKGTMRKAGKAPKTIRTCITLTRNIFVRATRDGYFSGILPTEGVNLPRADNRRLRYLERDEAEVLLKALERKSISLSRQALLSLHTGARASEIFGLTWADIRLEEGYILLTDTKSKKNRAAYLTPRTQQMLRVLKKESVQAAHDNFERLNPSGHLFPDRWHNAKRKSVSKVFARTVKELGFNDRIEDRRMKVCFHTLRHTYASWLVIGGTSLYKVKELLGHSSIQMTERYSHLSPDTLQEAVKKIFG